jgi:hypothetical protein
MKWIMMGLTTSLQKTDTTGFVQINDWKGLSGFSYTSLLKIVLRTIVFSDHGISYHPDVCRNVQHV